MYDCLVTVVHVYAKCLNAIERNYKIIIILNSYAHLVYKDG